MRESVDFCPFNPYENWAQKVLVPFKSNKRGITYPLLDREPIVESSENYRNLYPFGMLDDCYDVDHTHLEYAKRVNYIYDYYYTFSRYPDRLPSKEEVAKAWETLKRMQPIKVWSNIYNANFIPSKLRSVGLDYRTLSASHQFSDHEIGLLAELEHNRWNVEELLIGFKPVTEEQKRRIERDKLYKEECKANYQHVDIRPYRELGDDITGRNASEYDRCISIWLPLIVNEK